MKLRIIDTPEVGMLSVVMENEKTKEQLSLHDFYYPFCHNGHIYKSIFAWKSKTNAMENAEEFLVDYQAKIDKMFSVTDKQ